MIDLRSPARAATLRSGRGQGNEELFQVALIILQGVREALRTERRYSRNFSIAAFILPGAFPLAGSRCLLPVYCPRTVIFLVERLSRLLDTRSLVTAVTSTR